MIKSWRDVYVCDRCGMPEGRCIHAQDPESYVLQTDSGYRYDRWRCRMILAGSGILVGLFVAAGLWWR